MRFIRLSRPSLYAAVGGVSLVMLVAASALHGLPAETNAQAVAAHDVLQKNCTPCHASGGSGFNNANVTSRESLIVSKVVTAGKPEASALIQAVETGRMPLGGKLSDADKKTLRAWVEAGAPDWEAAAQGGTQGGKPAKTRAFISEAELLKAIVRDLEAAPERDRPYLRYYSLANLANNPEEAPAGRLELYRGALSKLVNHLSWNQEIVPPKAVNASGTLLRIDLRDFDWTPAIWQRIIAAYPYGLKARNLAGELRQIQTLSGAELPYIRFDWFTANASVPPLYHDILQLPDTVAALEQKLGVNADEDVARGKVARGGVRNSGVSHNNRVIERHRTPFGAYWKSFDFAGNQGEKNIFLNPLDFHQDGGEFIFNLPNGLQGYLVANSQGKRLNDAPIAIVRDLVTNRDDPVVHNGRSCIGCHTRGMQPMRDEMRAVLETEQKPAFDLEKAEALYVPQEELDRFLTEDEERFTKALQATGCAVPAQPADEPVSTLSLLYLGDVTVAQAAADAGLDVAEFKRRVGKSSELEKLGFGQLLTANGGIKRDAWEQYFGNLVEEIRLGDYLKPTQFDGHGLQAGTQDNRHSVSLDIVATDDERAALQARQDLLFWLAQSDTLKTVAGHGDFRLEGRLTSVANGTVTLVVKEETQGLSEEVTGPPSDLHFLTQQLADRINFRLTGNRLALSAPAASPTPAGAAVPVDPIAQIQQAVGGSGSVHIALNVDRGPGSTYHAGEKVQVRFKVDHDCFLQIKNIDAAGNVVNLFPNEYVPDGHVQAGRLYVLQDQNQADIISVDPNGVFGRETIIAFAAPTEEDLPAPKSKTLKVDGQGAGKFAQEVQRVASSGRASSATLQFFTVK